MNANQSMIVDADGKPFAMGHPSMTSHQAADFGRELGRWNPALKSADADLLPDQRVMVARTRDMIRNHGLASGAVQTHLDNVIGTGLLLQSTPNAAALGITQAQADELGEQIEAKWSLWAYDPDKRCDAARKLTFDGMCSLAYRMQLASGEVVSSAEWLRRPGWKFRTAIQMVDPDRLSTPDHMTDNESLRAGVKLDYFGAPLGYWIRRAHPNDYQRSGNINTFKWDFVERETRFGRQNIIHVFEQERAHQTRGKGGFVSVLSSLKMLEKYKGAALQAAILNATYAAVIESSMSSESVGAALGMSQNPMAGLTAFMGAQSAYHSEANINFDGVKVPHLMPGEKLSFMSPEHPTAAFKEFEQSVLRNIAGGLNLSYEQLARDYSQSNYSSARAAMLEAWRFFSGRRKMIAGEFATAVFALWLEEAIDNGEVVLPPGCPDFYDAKAAFIKCEWIGPGRGHIDPDKESKANDRDMRNGTKSFADICAENGKDWRTHMRQLAKEEAERKRLGMPAMIGSDPQASTNVPTQEDENGDDVENDDADNDAAPQRGNKGAGAKPSRRAAAHAPNITVNVEAAPAPNVTMSFDAGAFVTNVETPDVTVEAPVVNIEGSRYEAPSVTTNVAAPEVPKTPRNVIRAVVKTDDDGVPMEAVERHLTDDELAAEYPEHARALHQSTKG